MSFSWSDRTPHLQKRSKRIAGENKAGCSCRSFFVGQGPVSVVSFSGEKRTGNNKTTCHASDMFCI